MCLKIFPSSLNSKFISAIKCPFFINKTLIASRYLRYIPPKDVDGKSCTIENHEHRYNFKLYTVDEDVNDFLLRDEFIQRLEELSAE